MAIRSVKIGCMDEDLKYIQKSVTISSCYPFAISIFDADQDDGEVFNISVSDILTAIRVLEVDG